MNIFTILLIIIHQQLMVFGDNHSQILFNNDKHFQMKLADNLLREADLLLKNNLNIYLNKLNNLNRNLIKNADDQKCFDLLHKILANPLEKEWSAKSKQIFFELFLKINFFPSD